MLIIKNLQERDLFPKSRIMELYPTYSDSIENQDEFYDAVYDTGLISSGGDVLTDEMAVGLVDYIMGLPIGNDDKFMFLHFLDMDVQNHGESFRPIDNVLAAQWELIK